MDITRLHHLKSLAKAAQHHRSHHAAITQAAHDVLPPLVDTTLPVPAPAGNGG